MEQEFVQALLARLRDVERRLERLENKTPDIESLALRDGVSAPAAVTGQVQLYVDVGDGELKALDGSGNTAVLSSGL